MLKWPVNVVMGLRMFFVSYVFVVVVSVVKINFLIGSIKELWAGKKVLIPVECSPFFIGSSLDLNLPISASLGVLKMEDSTNEEQQSSSSVTVPFVSPVLGGTVSNTGFGGRTNNEYNHNTNYHQYPPGIRKKKRGKRLSEKQSDANTLKPQSTTQPILIGFGLAFLGIITGAKFSLEKLNPGIAQVGAPSTSEENPNEASGSALNPEASTSARVRAGPRFFFPFGRGEDIPSMLRAQNSAQDSENVLQEASRLVIRTHVDAEGQEHGVQETSREFIRARAGIDNSEQGTQATSRAFIRTRAGIDDTEHGTQEASRKLIRTRAGIDDTEYDKQEASRAFARTQATLGSVEHDKQEASRAFIRTQATSGSVEQDKQEASRKLIRTRADIGDTEHDTQEASRKLIRTRADIDDTEHGTQEASRAFIKTRAGVDDTEHDTQEASRTLIRTRAGIDDTEYGTQEASRAFIRTRADIDDGERGSQASSRALIRTRAGIDDAEKIDQKASRDLIAKQGEDAQTERDANAARRAKKEKDLEKKKDTWKFPFIPDLHIGDKLKEILTGILAIGLNIAGGSVDALKIITGGVAATLAVAANRVNHYRYDKQPERVKELSQEIKDLQQIREREIDKQKAVDKLEKTLKDQAVRKKQKELDQQKELEKQEEIGKAKQKELDEQELERPPDDIIEHDFTETDMIETDIIERDIIKELVPSESPLASSEPLVVSPDVVSLEPPLASTEPLVVSPDVVSLEPPLASTQPSMPLEGAPPSFLIPWLGELVAPDFIIAPLPLLGLCVALVIGIVVWKKWKSPKE